MCDIIVQNIPSDKRIKYYNGIDERLDDDGVMHRDTKRNDFRDISCLDQCDVLIYTSTLTAGVSYDNQHFDKLIGIYHQQTSVCSYFIQSLLRVRHFNQHTHDIYLLDNEESVSKPLCAQVIFEDITKIEENTIG